MELLSIYSSKDEILKFYRRVLFRIHPDKLLNPSNEKKLEYEILFNILFTSYKKYKKWN